MSANNGGGPSNNGGVSENYAASSRPSLASTRMAMVRARLSLPTIRRASGMFEGNHASIFTGHGHDFEDLIEYNYGDDVTDIDWKSSARAGHPIIRRFERESDVFTQIVVDTGIEMRGTAPSGEPKIDIALRAADLLGYLATTRGDRLGIVFGDTNGIKRFPARHGNQHLEFTLDTMEKQLRSSTGHSDVSALLEHILRLPQQRSLLIIITDEHWPGPADEQSLRRIRTRHEALVVQVADMPMTQRGVDRMKDVDGNVIIPAFLREDKKLSRELETQREAARVRARAALRSNKVRSGRINSTDAVVPVLFELLRREDHAY